MGGKNERGILDILRDTQAVITDSHFVYTSGKHGEIYVNKDALTPHTKEASEVGRMFAEKTKGLNIDVVVAPALGAIVLSQWTAFHLSEIRGKEVLGVYTEKDQSGNQILTRGHDKLVAGKDVFVVEDLTTTGGSVKNVVDSVRHAGGNVVMVGVMINRNPDNVNEETFGVPFFALGILPAESFPEEDCHLCKNGVPINTDVGHGRKFLESKKKQ